MTDQGWMVDDGTCDACVDGECWSCSQPVEFIGDDLMCRLHCCCDECYDLGIAPDEAVGK